MALEKDQERPISPNGSRKIKLRNMNYILDMPLMIGSTQNSVKKDTESQALQYNSQPQQTKLQLSSLNKGMMHAFQDSPVQRNLPNE